MSKTNQNTLFQSWGQKSQNENIKESNLSNNTVSAPKVCSNVCDVVDLCTDDDDLLICALEESMLYAQQEQLGDKPVSHILSTNKWKKPFVYNSEMGPKFGQPCLSTCDKNSKLFCNYGKSQTENTVIDKNVYPGFEDTDAKNPSQPELPGFDECAGRLWIYPTNYPVRDYQYNIVQICLFRNTLVTLPTGLGKTFIAAVVMYNFYRWYPEGKIVFMAPTKPLVAQQIEACYKIMGIPWKDTSEMTGSMNPTERQKAWRSKRVFFLTPQVLTNDLTRGTCPVDSIKCLVFDEAHKALGNHAYCQVVRETIKYTKDFRVLALTATPGSDIKAVQQVVTSLLISHIEIRTDDCIDIKPYTHQRTVDKIIIPLGQELTNIKTKFLQVISVVVSRLVRCGVLYRRDPASLSKFLLLKSRDMFRQNPPQSLPQGQFGVVEGDFALGMSLYHAYELLQRHGLRPFYNFLTGIVNGEKSFGRTRAVLLRNDDFNDVMVDLKEKFTQNNCSTSSRQSTFTSGHPKLEKLQEIVLEHFKKFQNVQDNQTACSTRIMIFSQCRDSVEEIRDMLSHHSPVVKVMSFIGQSSTGMVNKGFTQKEQLKVMKAFREGGYNTLVSTCVGEEGLDIGDVDLIICFDAHKSPIRLIQRMGRTGRKREGRVVMLVTEGKEEQIYNQSRYTKNRIHQAILNGTKPLRFYTDSQQMFPPNLTPVCHKMFMTIKQQDPPRKITKTKTSKNLTGTLKTFGISARKSALEDDGGITRKEYEELKDFLLPDAEVKTLQESCFHCYSGKKENCTDGNQQESARRELSLTEWLPWQNRQQKTCLFSHSLKTKHFVELVEFIELQQSLSTDEDSYDLEMRTFLNTDDVLKPGQTENVGDGILQFCSDEKREENVDIKTNLKTKRVNHKPVKFKRSEPLPIIEIIGDESDEDLPIFDLGSKLYVGDKNNIKIKQQVEREMKTNNKSILDLKESITNDRDKTSVQNVLGGKESIPNELNKSTKIVLDGIKSVLYKTKIKSEKSVPSPNQNNKCKSDNKRIKINGSILAVQNIASDDRGDFQDLIVFNESITDVHETVQNDDKMDTDDGNHPVVSSGNIVTKNNIFPVGNVEENVTCPEMFRCLSLCPSGTASRFRVPNPPSLSEITEVFSVFANQTCLPKLDLMKLVLDWTDSNHFEDTDGKLADDSSLVNFDLTPGSTESRKRNSLEVSEPNFTSLKSVIPVTSKVIDSGTEKVSGLDQPDCLGNKKDTYHLTLKTSPGSNTCAKLEVNVDVQNVRNGGLSEDVKSEDLINALISYDTLQKSISVHSSDEFTKSKSNLTSELYAEIDCQNNKSTSSYEQKEEKSKVDVDSFFSDSFDDVFLTPILEEIPQTSSDPVTFTQAMAFVHSTPDHRVESELCSDKAGDDTSTDNCQNKLSPKHSTSTLCYGDEQHNANCSQSGEVKNELYIKTALYEHNSLYNEDLYVSPSKCESNVNLYQKQMIILHSRYSNASDAADVTNLKSLKENVDLLTSKNPRHPDDLRNFDDEFVLPKFDLEFEFNEDVIPPSPCESLTYSTFSFVRSQHPLSNKSHKTLFSDSSAGLINSNGNKVKMEAAELENEFDVIHSSPFSPSLLEPYDIEDEMKIHFAVPKSRETVVKSSSPVAESTKMNARTIICQNSDMLKKKQRSPLSLSKSMRKAVAGSHAEFKHQTSPCEPSGQGSRSKVSKPMGSENTHTVKIDISADVANKPYQAQYDLDLKPDGEDRDFTGKRPRKPRSKRRTAANPITNKKQCDFIEYEAVLSDQERGSSDEDDSEMDVYEDSFVNDSTQMTQDNVDMHAVYLKSVHSPITNKVKFIQHHDVDVFSQVQSENDTQYMEDSFCVGDDYNDDDDTDEKEENDKWHQCKHKRRPQRNIKLFKGRKRVGQLSGSSSDEEARINECSPHIENYSRMSRRKVHRAIVSSSGEESPVKLPFDEKSYSKDAVINKISDSEDVQHRQICLVKRLKDTNVSYKHTVTVGNSLMTRHGLAVCETPVSRQDMDVSHTSVSPQNVVVKEIKRECEKDFMKQKLKQEILNDKQSLSVNSEDDHWRALKSGVEVTCKRENAKLLSGSEGLSLVSETAEDECSHSTSMLVNTLCSSKNRRQLVVLVDSREISGAQDIVSCLRLQHKLCVVARQLTACDYILSNRLAVDRRQFSDFSNRANCKKLIDQVQMMCSLYDRCCIIVERDRVKPGEEKSAKSSHRSKYSDRTMAFLSQSNIKLMFSSSQGETATLLSELCQLEAKKGMNITVPVDLNLHQEQVYLFYTSILQVNCSQALSLWYNFKSVSHFLNSTSKEISIKGQMSQTRANDIYSFIRHKFDLQMMPSTR